MDNVFCVGKYSLEMECVKSGHWTKQRESKFPKNIRKFKDEKSDCAFPAMVLVYKDNWE